MEYNSSVNMILPDSIDFIENDFDNEDIAHEQTNQNEIIELIMATFGEQEELSSDEGSDSLNTSGSSHHSSDEPQMLFTNNNITDANYLQQQNKLLHPHQQVLFSTPSLLPSTDVHDFEINGNHSAHNTRSPYDEHDNNELHRAFKDSELRFQQMEYEKKLSDSESLIESLHRKVNELQQYESNAHSQQDYELVLFTIREKYEQEVTSLNEKLHNMEMNLQEKNVEVDGFRVQLEIAYKNNEKAVYDRLETVNHLNEQLQDCQGQLNRTTEDKDKFEFKCQELQSEIRTLHDRFSQSEHEVDNAVVYRITIPTDHHNISEHAALAESLINENIRLKDRIDEFASNEKQLVKLTEELQRQIQEYDYRLNRSDSSSSIETVITTSNHTEQTRNVTNEIEVLKKDYADLKETYDYEKHELQTMIEQLREDVIDLDHTKQLYLDVCEEKKYMEDRLRSNFEFELKSKLDELYRILEKEYNEKILFYKNNQTSDGDYDRNSEQRLKELYQEIERSKVEHEKQINELNNELDRLRTNDDAQNRLAYTEKEFEQLKNDYYNLNLKQKELLNTCSTLENQNQDLLTSIEQEKLLLKQTIENEKDKRLNEHQKQELSSTHNTTDHNEINLKEEVEALRLRVEHYEDAITQYEQYREKFENNLHKLTQQRDTYKNELKLTREMLTNKETEYNQLKIRLDEYEKHSVNNKQHESHAQELNQTRLKGTEREYHEKLHALELEKCQLEQRLQDANQALNLADSHLEKEIEKIKLSLEQEYNRRYEQDQKQHQHDLQQARQALTKEIEKQRSIVSPTKVSNVSLQDTEEIKQLYRTEIDRLCHENNEFRQHQKKLIETHQKQMQIMKKELDEGYNNVINEFQREQTRLQTRYDQLKHQSTDAQQTIEQLKSNLNKLKTTHFNDSSIVKETYTNEKHTVAHDNRHRHDNLEYRLDNLVKLLEQSNDALNQERVLHTKQEFEYQQTISSLQRKIADMIRQHIEAADEIKRQLHQERLINQKRMAPRPTSVPEFSQTDFSTYSSRSDHVATIDKFRATIAHGMDNIEASLKKQIQNELIRSRNSMIKEIRREIFEKITRVLRSQGVPDTTIDMHIFELDRLVSQMAQDCLNSLTTSSPFSSNSSSLSFHITPPSQQNRAVIYHSLPTKSTPPSKKTVECLYMTPTMNRKPTSLSPHCRRVLDNDCRSKSASNMLIPGTIQSPYTDKFQRSTYRNLKTRTYRSEDDLMFIEQQKNYLNDNAKEYQQPNIRALPKQYEQKTSSLPGYTRAKTRTYDGHYAVSCTIINNHPEEDDEDEDELTWPQQPSTTISSTQTNGLKTFVRSGLKLFNASHNNKNE